VLDALYKLPDLIDARATRRGPAGYLDEQLVALDVVPAGWWQRLVMAPERPAGTVDRAAYVFCVLEQFHQRLRSRDIFATASSRWILTIIDDELAEDLEHRVDYPRAVRRRGDRPNPRRLGHRPARRRAPRAPADRTRRRSARRTTRATRPGHAPLPRPSVASPARRLRLTRAGERELARLRGEDPDEDSDDEDDQDD
jgi:hypothetical protein